MNFEELYDDLFRKYGDEFNWQCISFADKYFVQELKSEISENHPLCKVKWAVARCTSNDDVLFLDEDDNWYIVHLTYSMNNKEGFPIYKKFLGLGSAKEFIEKQFRSEFLCG